MVTIKKLQVENNKLRETLRDQFASAALTGFMSLLSNNNVLAQMKGIEDQDKHLADRSYAIANAMLKAREES